MKITKVKYSQQKREMIDQIKLWITQGVLRKDMVPQFKAKYNLKKPTLDKWLKVARKEIGSTMYEQSVKRGKALQQEVVNRTENAKKMLEIQSKISLQNMKLVEEMSNEIMEEIEGGRKKYEKKKIDKDEFNRIRLKQMSLLKTLNKAVGLESNWKINKTDILEPISVNSSDITTQGDKVSSINVSFEDFGES